MKVTENNYKEGDKVVRGENYIYGIQDYWNGRPSVGVISHNSEKGWATVKWESGSTFRYRVGHNYSYDLEFYKPKRKDPLNLL